VALYPAVAFDEEAAEHLRPSMVYAYLDAPEETRAREGLRREDLAEAALAMHAGDDRAARRLIDDDRLDQLVLRGRPEDVSQSPGPTPERTICVSSSALPALPVSFTVFGCSSDCATRVSRHTS
jgi:hypothetical protein